MYRSLLLPLKILFCYFFLFLGGLVCRNFELLKVLRYYSLDIIQLKLRYKTQDFEINYNSNFNVEFQLADQYLKGFFLFIYLFLHFNLFFPNGRSKLP